MGDSATPVTSSEECRLCVGWWLQEENWVSGVPLQVQPPSPLFTNVSQTGWGAHHQNLTAAGM